MKIALFHHMGQGGAKRALYEQVALLAAEPDVSIDMYVIDAESSEAYLDLRPYAAKYHDYSLPEASWGEWPLVRHMEPFWRLTRMEQLGRQIARDIDAKSYDVAYINQSVLTQAPPLLQWLKTPSVYYVHEPRRSAFEYEFIYEPIAGTGMRGALRRFKHHRLQARINAIDMAGTRSATSIITNSYYSVESIARAYGVDARVCYLGVDATTFRLSEEDRQLLLLDVGALHFNKQHDFLIEAISLVPLKVRPKLVVVYNRSMVGYRPKLERQAKRQGVDVDFKEGIADEELAQLYRSSLALVGVARLEPFGLTPLEALAVGTPTIAVKQAGYRETVVDGRTGVLVERDVHMLASAITQLSSGTMMFDPRSLRAHAIKHWSWDTSVAQLKQTLTHAASK